MHETKRDERIHEIIARLRQRYPDARCSLEYNSVFELLIATMLSAQCTDERVNMVTATLFKKYRTIEDYAKADPAELEQDIYSTGFYRTKAKNIQAAARRILEAYNGQVPKTMEELLTLPGVARKTANLILGTGYGITSGIVVDTHVKRVSKRLGLATSENPEKIERELCELIPRKDWIDFSHLLVFHGRAECKPRPLCSNCCISELCPSKLH
ncbi:MAG: endonuclease III [Acidobacteriota bacterium]|nr:endonuclease III [Blastocatellia bacterium]MDW8412024.1 endonuclease III [Acidobacteriota bacterium]